MQPVFASRDRSFYEAVYDILVEHCGAYPGEKKDFVEAHTSKCEPPTEWRFRGTLGFGGKFWRYAGRLYVNCYPEDETPQRLESIARANAKLDELLTAVRR